MHVSARNPNRKSANKGGSGPLVSDKYCYALETGQPHYVCIPTNGTNIQIQSIGGIMENVTTETLEPSMQNPSLTTTSLLEDFLVKLSQLLEKEEDLMTPEGLSFLKSHEFSETKDPDIFFSKTLKAYLVMKAEKLSRQYLGFSPTLGMTINGKYLIPRTSVSHRIGKECSLSEILEENVDQKYFLSEKTVQGLMKGFMKPKLLEHLPREDIQEDSTLV
jgi:hypothetical protein